MGNKCFLLFPIMQSVATQDQILANKRQTIQYYLQVDNQLSFLKEITFGSDDLWSLPIFYFSQDTLSAAQASSIMTRAKNMIAALAFTVQGANSLTAEGNYELVQVT